MKTYRINLKPLGPILNPPSAQTLFGAICWAIRTMDGENRLKPFLDAFPKEPGDRAKPPLILSSSFPHVDGVDLFPKPFLEGLNPDTLKELSQRISMDLPNLLEKYKKLKKVSLVPFKTFSMILIGKENELTIFEKYLAKKSPFNKKYSIPEHGILAHSKIDRLINSTGGTGELFYQEINFYAKGSSLYFLLKTEDINAFLPYLRLAADLGIGGERSLGYNRFDLSFEEVDWDFLESRGNKVVLLSKMEISEPLVEWELSSYSLGTEKPKVETSFGIPGQLYKRRIFSAEVGSILKLKSKEPYLGLLFESSKFGNTAIYTYGMGFPTFFDGEL